MENFSNVVRLTVGENIYHTIRGSPVFQDFRLGIAIASAKDSNVRVNPIQSMLCAAMR